MGVVVDQPPPSKTSKPTIQTTCWRIGFRPKSSRFVSPFIDGSGRARHNRLGMPRSRIEIYWKKSETAPEGVIAQVRVTDGCGSDYLLPYPCKLTKDGWVNAASGKLLAVRPTYWKLYVETLSRKKPRERSPQLNPPQAERD